MSMKELNKIEINSIDYSQCIHLPSNSVILDILRTKIYGDCKYYLLYEYDTNMESYTNREFYINRYSIEYNLTIELNETYITTLKGIYGDNNYYMFYYRKTLTEAEIREIKIDTLLG